MSRIKLAIYGACGRMGRAIVNRVGERPDFEVAALLESGSHPLQGKELYPGLSLSADLTPHLAHCGCIIDFSESSASGALVDRLLRTPTQTSLPALVIGTTGQSEGYLDAVRRLALRIPVVLSPNMSIGVNLSYHLAREAARIVGDRADVEIIEAHHRHKKDAPSGTALALGRAICQERGQNLDQVAVYTRKGQTGERPENAIGFSVVRGGNIIGTHSVLFAMDNETIEIKHTALDRNNFADGALWAASWLVSGNRGKPRPAALYNMADVLQL